MPKVNKNRQNPSSDIIVAAIRAINGEITPNMRMIAFSYNGKEAKFKFYVAKEPSEEDREHADIAALNFEVGLSPLDALDVEIVVTSEPFGLLEPLDFVLFQRSED